MAVVYISGPITGHPDGNREAFREAAARLTEAGHNTVNPCRIIADHDGECWPHELSGAGGSPHSYACHLRADILALFECEAIHMLTGWEDSKGARAELAIAKALGLDIV